MLIQSLIFLRDKGVSEKSMQFFGQELLNETWKIAKMNFSLRNVNYNLGTRNANTFSDDLFENEKFDFILSNPPFNQDFLEEDYGDIAKTERFKYGVVFGDKTSNYMFFQHVISHLNENGIGAVVMHSAAGDSSKEEKIREKMIEANIIESIILLPGGVFKNTSIQSTIWIFNKNKSNSNVLFVDLQNHTKRVDTQEILLDEIIEKSASLINSFRNGTKIISDIPFITKTNRDLLDASGKSLNPSRYIVKDEKIIIVKTEDVIEDLNNAFESIDNIKNDIKKIIKFLSKK